MGTVTNPLGSMVQGLVTGRELALRIQQAADEHARYQQELQDAQTKASIGDVMNHMQMLAMGAKPVDGGYVQDQMNAPDTANAATPGTTIPGQDGGSGAGTITGKAPDVTSGAMPAVTIPGGQPYTVYRPVDKSRVKTVPDSQGNKWQYEMPTLDEQIQRQQQTKNQQELAEALGKSDIQQRVLNSQRQLRGVPLPPDVAGAFPAGTLKVLPEEIVAAREAAQKNKDERMKVVGNDQHLVDIGAPGQSPQVIAGAPIPSLQDRQSMVDASIPPDKYPEENARARSAVENAIRLGLGPNAIQGAIKDSADRIGHLESSVAQAKATQPIKIETAVQTANAKADAGGLSPDDYARAGEQYMRTGVMPAMGRDSVTRSKIVKAGNQWARDNGLNPSDVVKMQAAYAGDKESLKKFQTQRDQIASFEETASKNLDNFIGLGGKVVDTGSPWLNLPLRMLSDKLVGSENMAAVNAARQVASNEIAKVTSGGGLSGVLSDSARKEVEAYNPKDATLKQTLAVAKVLKLDMANRHQAMDATLDDIKARIGATPGGATGKPPLITNKADFDKLPSGAVYTESDGNTYRKP